MWTIGVIDKLLKYQNLTHLTNNPDEWVEVGTNTWQNKRNSACFSSDGGKTYHNIDDKVKKTYTAKNYV